MKRNPWLTSLMLAGVLTLLLGGSGCIFDPNDEGGGGGGGGGEVYEKPTDRDILMANFEKSYENLNLEEYDKVLHPDYLFVPLPDDLEDLGLVAGQYVLKAQEMAITEKIFSGSASGSGGPGITGIDVVTLDQSTTWEDSTNPLFPSSKEALFEVEIHFNHADGYYRVKGQQRFWVVNVPENDGSPHWYLRGQQDFTTSVP